jgi:type II secretory pathway component PulM
MNIKETLENKITIISDQIEEYLDRLSVRERIMVIFTTIFVIVAGVGASLWYMHQAAENQQKRIQELNDFVTLMQTKAAIMKPMEDASLSASDKIQRIAQAQGLGVSAQENSGKVQIMITHQSYAVLGNFMTQLAQMGLSIEKMELISEGGQIKLTATVI